MDTCFSNRSRQVQLLVTVSVLKEDTSFKNCFSVKDNSYGTPEIGAKGISFFSKSCMRSRKLLSGMFDLLQSVLNKTAAKVSETESTVTKTLLNIFIHL